MVSKILLLTRHLYYITGFLPKNNLYIYLVLDRALEENTVLSFYKYIKQIIALPFERALEFHVGQK